MHMANPVRELSYGAVQIYSEDSDTLGVGSYGKVCKAKCGQLPCAAKLLHNTMFDTNMKKFVEQFEQECKFLRMIKHPNIVQFLGTTTDLQSRRLVLLMELMDESLTRFLEQSTGPLPYHTQLNICQDVALALAYLHSNDIIHRDLSSNNVLLIGGGSRAKVTDFGMSKLEGMNPRMTPLTMCPGTPAYMPPEALVTPPQYSSKLDCFSHGVLAIQIATRQFPNPKNATTTIEDARFPTGRVVVFVPEFDRRKKDIDLVAPDHPLLPLVLHCLKDRDTERPSADELCERLATLKREPRYTHSVEQSREQNMSLQTLQQELERAKVNQECHQKHSQEKEEELKQAKVELEGVVANYESLLCECQARFEQQIKEKDDELTRIKKDFERKLKDREDQVATDRPVILLSQEQQEQENTESGKKPQASDNNSNHNDTEVEFTDPVNLTWRQGAPVSEDMSSSWGAAVAHGNTAYFSIGCNVYSYTLPEGKWTTLPPCDYRSIGLAIVNDKLTTIGGSHGIVAATDILLSLSCGGEWENELPPMPIARVRPAAVATPTQLVVAGGKIGFVRDALPTVEVLDLNTLLWHSASRSPIAFECPHMTLCGGYLYLSEHNVIFSCSVEELLESCVTGSFTSNGGSVWTRLTDIPVPRGASLATLRGHVLAIGGSDKNDPTGAIHSYDRSTNTWSIVGEMPTPRYNTLATVLPSNELIVVGGHEKEDWCYKTEIGSLI